MFQLLTHISHLTLIVASGLNFLIYSFVGQTFRREFKRLLVRWRPRSRNLSCSQRTNLSDLGSRRPSPGSHDPAGHQGVDHEDHDDGEEDVVEEAAGYQEVHHDRDNEVVAVQPATSPPLSPPGHQR